MPSRGLLEEIIRSRGSGFGHPGLAAEPPSLPVQTSGELRVGSQKQEPGGLLRELRYWLGPHGTQGLDNVIRGMPRNVPGLPGLLNYIFRRGVSSKAFQETKKGLQEDKKRKKARDYGRHP